MDLSSLSEEVSLILEALWQPSAIACDSEGGKVHLGIDWGGPPLKSVPHTGPHHPLPWVCACLVGTIIASAWPQPSQCFQGSGQRVNIGTSVCVCVCIKPQKLNGQMDKGYR